MTRSVTLLGSTGVIGTRALEVIAVHPDRFTVTALAAGGRDVELAARQAVEVEAEALAVTDADRAEVTGAIERARRETGRAASPEVLVGPDAAARIAGAGVDVVLNTLGGSSGLAATLTALTAGSNVASANRDPLVAGGALVRAARLRPDQVVPVDDTLSTVARAVHAGEVARLLLAAPGEARHGRTEPPTVSAGESPGAGDGDPMGTTNSATLIATGFALIEAHVLFDMPLERIDAVIHPEAIVGSLVEFVDGTMTAHAAPSDPRHPIGLGLSWPERLAGVAEPRRRWDPATWTFEPIDHDALPAIELCRAAAAASATHPAALQAANEECVAAFLDERLPFTRITEVIAHVLDDHDGVEAGSLDVERLREVDGWARTRARELIDRHR